jgi:hypothetical protein
MKPYSKDLRLRVLAAVERGMPRKEVAETFSVSFDDQALAQVTPRDRGCGGGQADPRTALSEGHKTFEPLISYILRGCRAQP